MDTINYMDFLEGSDIMPLSEVRETLRGLEAWKTEAIDLITQLSQYLNSNFLIKIRRFNQIQRLVKSKVKDIDKISKCYDHLFRQKGFCKTEASRRWLKGKLDSSSCKDQYGIATFGSIKNNGKILKIVATDLRYRRPRLYTPEEYAATEVSLAVQASTSIPIFFCRFNEGASYLVPNQA